MLGFLRNLKALNRKKVNLKYLVTKQISKNYLQVLNIH